MIKFLGLGKKKEPEKMEQHGKGFVPVDKVKQLSGRGFSEPEIIDILRKDGFSSEEIDRALTQALRIGVTGEEQQPQQLPTLKELQSQSFAGVEESPQMGFNLPQEQQPSSYQDYYQQEGYSTEELVEAIVQERMTELDDRLTEFREKHSNLERKLADIHHRLNVISKGRSQQDDALLAKMDSMKDSLDEIEGKMSSLEKAFKDALPALIESVRSLSDLVQRLKKEA